MWLVVACELLAILAFLLTGVRTIATWVRIGLVVSTLSVRGEVDATARASVFGAGRSIELSLVLVPMLLTVAYLWLAGRAGRRAADQRTGEGVVLTAAIAAAAAGAAAGAVAAIAAALARTSIAGVHLAADPATAALGAAILGAAAAAVGAVVRARGDDAVGRVLRGGLVAYGWALLLLIVGVLVLADLEPSVTRRYLTAVDRTGALAPAVIGAHVVALPAQSALLLAPASGPCLHVVLGTPALSLCPWSLRATDVGLALVPDRVALTPWAWLLSAVPPIAAFLGGRRAALRPSRRPVAEGVGAGVVFAVVAVAGAVLASSRIDGTVPGVLPIAVQAPPAAIGGAVLLWGLVGGALGGWLEGRRYDERPSPRRTSE